jgi:AcrR family transcriptional regulator
MGNPANATIAELPAERSVGPRAGGTKREALIAAARESFGRLGYHATATNDLVAVVSATRGALYHHFADKKDLFTAVAREVARELSRGVTAEVMAMPGTNWERITEGLKRYLKMIAASPEAQRILLIDGPSVLGWKDWRALQSRIVLPGMVEGLRLLMEDGAIRPRPKEPLAQLILAALNDAALAIAHAPEPAAVYDEMCEALLTLFRGLTI